MDGIKQQAYRQKQEALQTRQSFQLRKENREMRAELDRLKDQNQATVNRIQKEFDKEAFEEQHQLESKLSEIRRKNEEIIANEEKRYERMREESELTHKQQLEELRISQEKEIEEQTESHQEYLKNARQKFEAAKLKYEV